MEPSNEPARLERLRQLSDSTGPWIDTTRATPTQGVNDAPDDPISALLDDPWWDDGDDDEDLGDLTLEQARDQFVAALDDVPTDLLAKIFPARDVGLAVAEAVDDLVPIVDEATADSVAAALSAIDDGLTRCAEMKQQAKDLLPAEALRQILTEIRADKERVLSLQRPLRSRQDELDRAAAEAAKEAQTWRDAGVAPPTGFAAMFAKPGDAQRYAEQAREAKRQTDELNREILAGRADTMRRQRESWDRQHQEFLKLLQGRRY